MPSGTGSGFVWDTEGHIVTNFHVVDRGEQFAVMLYDTSVLDATLVGYDPATDLAVLKLVNPPADLVPVAMPDGSDSPQVGQMALAIGNPYGLDHTLTAGTVSAVGREIQGYGGVTIRGMIQTDAAINSGNSGGPLVDSSGQLMGVNTMIYSRSGSSAGLGFAVPAATVQRIVPQLIQEGRVKRPNPGITVLSAKVAQRTGLQGVVIEAVTPNSPAEQAGLVGLTVDRGRVRIGDVIVTVDGARVTTPNELFHALDTHPVGAPLVVGLVRDGVPRQVSFEME